MFHLLDFIFPGKKELLHERLTTNIIIEQQDQLLQRGVHHLDTLVAASSYQNQPVLKQAIQALKYEKQTSYAEKLASLLLHAYAHLPLEPNAILCPVPLHWTRYCSRGFNQATLLAKFLAKQTDTEVQHLLKRTKATGHQAHRNRAERMQSMSNAFRCKKAMCPPYVVLIDDVMTTGSTLDSCAKELKRCGANTVVGLVLAHDRWYSNN